MRRLRSFVAIGRDLRAIVQRDPATGNIFTAMLCSNGFHALCLYRFSHFLYVHRYFIVARLLCCLGRFLFGIEIHPAAKIGSGIVIDHGTGVVIGETAEIGNDVTIYHGVTLGGTGKEKGKRHPTVHDGAVISTGAKVLGAITVGRGAKIGANSVVLSDVPPNATVVGIPARVVRIAGKKVPTKRTEKT